MDRYHFNIEDGDPFHDPDGTACASLDDARVEAVKILAQTLRDKPAEFWRHEHLEVSVTDPSGLILFCVRASAHDAPVLSGRG